MEAVFGALHRVISEHSVGRSGDVDVAMETHGSPQMPRFYDSNINVIEPDNRFSEAMDIAPLRVVGSGPSPSSSLSDTSMLAEGDETIVTLTATQLPPPEFILKETIATPHPRATRGFGRTDSNANDSSSGSHRASSQNSSRDLGWGWYEDVHGAEQGEPRREANSGVHLAHSKTKNTKLGVGLVPQVSNGEVLVTAILRNNFGNSDASAMAVTAPTYVLEESLSSQKLWKDTAGTRPPQPAEERAFYEKMWAQNFVRSQVQYSMPVEVLTATSPISLSPFAEGNFEGPTTGNDLANYDYTSGVAQDSSNGDVAEAALVSRMNDPAGQGVQLRQSGLTVINKKVKGSDGDLTIMVRGDNVFGTTVSKSFARSNELGGPISGVDTVNISIASFRVVESKKNGKYAQFLVIYREGGIRDTIGVWKRYRDFEVLAHKVTHAHEGCAAVIANISPMAVTEEPDTEHLPNAITSWRLLKKRKRWYRCLDAGYLSLKVFLLERFLHDILFESSSPKLLREFVSADSGMT